jgi:hypothetical protein
MCVCLTQLCVRFCVCVFVSPSCACALGSLLCSWIDLSRTRLTVRLMVLTVRCLPSEATVRIIDLFLLHGRPILFRFVIALLMMHEEELARHPAVRAR